MKAFCSYCLQQGFGGFFVFKVGLSVSHKKGDKHEARCDPQARIKWAAVGFLAFTGRMEVNTKNTKELP